MNGRAQAWTAAPRQYHHLETAEIHHVTRWRKFNLAKTLAEVLALIAVNGTCIASLYRRKYRYENWISF